MALAMEMEAPAGTGTAKTYTRAKLRVDLKLHGFTKGDTVHVKWVERARNALARSDEDRYLISGTPEFDAQSPMVFSSVLAEFTV